MKAVIVPVKSTDRAKRRLGRILASAERQRLSVAMFTDVGRCLSESRVSRVFVVTSDRGIATLARGLDFGVLEEASQVSESASVDWASHHLERHGFREILRLPADIPLVRPQDIADLFAECGRERGAVLCPSDDGTGTNALLRSPGTIFPSHFGENSLKLHLAAARDRNCTIRTIQNHRIALDIDTPDDLLSFLERAHGGETLSLLNDLRISTRCNRTHKRTQESL